MSFAHAPAARRGGRPVSRVRPAGRALPLLWAAALLAGCAAAPRVPDAATAVAVPARFKEAAPAPQADADTPEAWWTLFGDPVLDGLQQRLVLGNENLKAAVAQVEIARAALGSARAAQAPLVTATAGAGRGDNGAAARPQDS